MNVGIFGVGFPVGNYVQAFFRHFISVNIACTHCDNAILRVEIVLVYSNFSGYLGIIIIDACFTACEYGTCVVFNTDDRCNVIDNYFNIVVISFG